MSRALLSEPGRSWSPTSRRRASTSGARAEIYRILREVTDRGVPGRGRLERRARARGPVRPGHRDVARAGRRDARGRRGERGADRPRRRQRDDRTRRSRRRAGPSRLLAAAAASSRATTRRSSSWPLVMIALGAYVCDAERPLLLGLQHHLGDVRLRGARLHLARPDVRPAARRASTCRSARSPASSSSWGRSSSSTGSHPRSGCSGSS